MVALANLYTILDVSAQQIAIGLATLPLLVAMAWYVSHPIHRRQLFAAPLRPGARIRSRGDGFLANATPQAWFEPAPLLQHVHGPGGEIIGRRVDASMQLHRLEQGERHT
jgi:hypothetical protein